MFNRLRKITYSVDSEHSFAGVWRSLLSPCSATEWLGNVTFSLVCARSPSDLTRKYTKELTNRTINGFVKMSFGKVIRVSYIQVAQECARKTKNNSINAFRPSFYIWSALHELYWLYDHAKVINIVHIFKYRDQAPTHRTPLHQPSWSMPCNV